MKPLIVIIISNQSLNLWRFFFKAQGLLQDGRQEQRQEAKQVGTDQFCQLAQLQDEQEDPGEFDQSREALLEATEFLIVGFQKFEFYFKSCDVNNDGQLDEQEFEEFIKKLTMRHDISKIFKE